MQDLDYSCLHPERVCQGSLCSESEIEDLTARIKELEEHLEAVSLENQQLRK